MIYVYGRPGPVRNARPPARQTMGPGAKSVCRRARAQSRVLNQTKWPATVAHASGAMGRAPRGGRPRAAPTSWPTGPELINKKRANCSHPLGWLAAARAPTTCNALAAYLAHLRGAKSFRPHSGSFDWRRVHLCVCVCVRARLRKTCKLAGAPGRGHMIYSSNLGAWCPRRQL